MNATTAVSTTQEAARGAVFATGHSARQNLRIQDEGTPPVCPNSPKQCRPWSFVSVSSAAWAARRLHRKAGTAGLLKPVPASPRSQRQEPCARSRRARCSIAAARFASRCLPERVSFLPATPAILQEMPNTPDVIQALRIFTASILPPQGAWLHRQLGLRSPLPADRKNGVPRIWNSGGEPLTGNPRASRTSCKYIRLGVQ